MSSPASAFLCSPADMDAGPEKVVGRHGTQLGHVRHCVYEQKQHRHKEKRTSTLIGSLARRCASLPSVSIMIAMLYLQSGLFMLPIGNQHWQHWCCLQLVWPVLVFRVSQPTALVCSAPCQERFTGCAVVKMWRINMHTNEGPDAHSTGQQTREQVEQPVRDAPGAVDGPHALNDRAVPLMVAMRKVEACDIHPIFSQLPQGGLIITRRTDRTDDLRLVPVWVPTCTRHALSLVCLHQLKSSTGIMLIRGFLSPESNSLGPA